MFLTNKIPISKSLLSEIWVSLMWTTPMNTTLMRGGNIIYIINRLIGSNKNTDIEDILIGR